jgi:pimeloyl-ACP methyl ester carboxylesterase
MFSLRSRGGCGKVAPVKNLVFLLLGLAGLVGAAGIALYLFQDKLIYFPRPYSSGDLDGFAARGGKCLPFSTPHGAQTAFYLPCQGVPRQIWCCFAGNGGQALAWETFARANATDGRAFLLVEWPGYGASEGKPSPATIRESVRGATNALAAHLGLPLETVRSRCAVTGHSLGCAGALIAAGELGACQAILFAPFTSLREMAVLRKGPLIAQLLKHDYDNRTALDNLAVRPGARVTIFHGTEDEVIPIRMARDLRERHPGTVRLIELPGLGHGGLFAAASTDLASAMALEP